MSLAIYLDDSGSHPESSVITIAGFLAPIKDWASFEQYAQNMFCRYNITCLHARDFHASDGEFKGWSGVKKRSFCTELSIALSLIYPIGISISCEKSSFDDRKKKYSAWHNLSSFGSSFDRLMLKIYKRLFYEMGPEMWHPDMDLSVIMESGNKNNNNALDCFNSLKESSNLVDEI